MSCNCKCDEVPLVAYINYDYNADAPVGSRYENNRVELRLAGVTIYAHPLSHRPYDDRDEERAREEAAEAFAHKIQALLSAFE